MVVAPYLLGSLADRFGLGPAFTVEPVLIGLCLVLLLAGRRAEVGEAEGCAVTDPPRAVSRGRHPATEEET